jgi:hypothetical protein
MIVRGNEVKEIFSREFLSGQFLRCKPQKIGNFYDWKKTLCRFYAESIRRFCAKSPQKRILPLVKKKTKW